MLFYLFINTIIVNFVNYDNYIFSRSWVPSFCKFNKQDICSNYSNINKFIIHGLWPTYSNGSWPQYCSNEEYNKEAFIMILPDMISQWSDNIQNDIKLWTHEWEKHGTCSIGNIYIKNSNDYFISGLWINMRLNDNYQLITNNIKPSNVYYYNKSYLQRIFNSGLVCKEYNNLYLLTELRSQLSLNFSIIEPVIDDNSCGNEIYLVPFNSPI